MWQVREGQPTSRILIAKCCVSPLLGATIPCGELQSLVILHHLALVVAESFPSKFATISMLSDSMCSLGALSKSGGLLQPFFANQVSEIKRIRGHLQDLACELPSVHHILGTSNPVDLGTQGHVSLCDLGSDSLWQQGPPSCDSPMRSDSIRALRSWLLILYQLRR